MNAVGADPALRAAMLRRFACGVFVVLGAACGGDAESVAAPAAATPSTVPITGGLFRLGEASSDEPSVDLELRRDGTFEWRTDPKGRGDWLPAGGGTWVQRDALVSLRPREPDLTMPFAPMVQSALAPFSHVTEAELTVVDDRRLLTKSIAKEDGRTWAPPAGTDETQITWRRAR